MIVQKFGGSSVESSENIKKIIKITGASKKTVRVVVVSAFSGITDALLEAGNIAKKGLDYKPACQSIAKRHSECAKALLSGGALEEELKNIHALCSELENLLMSISIIKEFSPRSQDYVLSFGERLSAPLIAAAFNAAGIEAEYLDSRKVIETDNNFTCARPSREAEAKIQKYFAERKKLQVAAGFIGATSDGLTTTLGRGGSDYSAAIFGAALGADEIEIWTDVDGIQTCDPKLVRHAFTIPFLNYNEAMELSHFGAKVLYPPTVLPALEKNIPLRIRNTFNTECEGTLICAESTAEELPVKGISTIRNISLLRVQGTGMMGASGFAARLFRCLSQKGINIILITQSSSEYSICFAVLPADGPRARDAVCTEFAGEIKTASLETPSLENNLAVIAVVGSKMKSTPGISGRVFYALGRNGINVAAIAQGSSEINISFVIKSADVPRALNNIHEAFFLSGVRSVNLFLVGLGLIGGTLLRQIAEQKSLLEDEYKIKINIAGIANSKKMLFASMLNTDEIPPEDAKEQLDARGAVFGIDSFTEEMIRANLANSAFCDCTASEVIAASYEKILRASIPVVTPNKKANSGTYDYYKRLTTYSKDKGVPYLYEVNVCAALPVISTLRDLHLAGDTILRIEAVFSGTLSFIFNNFDGSKTFSALVREAKALGYTEPDPRDDLNAFDAARKALIISRECGRHTEFSDVKIEPILPESCFKAKSVDDFFKELEKFDSDFEKKRAAAAAEGKALRYIAVIEGDSARLELRGESEGSPFRSLVDSDNIVVITSRRYSKLPMVIKGPGAGAEVTAGGVFADIVRIARTLV